ncbi:hypothetical protein B0H13DRAFT_1888764 [Mycena leptocephala]|nr:hypothetical protein B0H13DRAFT_1888764 [Mycena leptocephala]
MTRLAATNFPPPYDDEDAQLLALLSDLELSERAETPIPSTPSPNVSISRRIGTAPCPRLRPNFATPPRTPDTLYSYQSPTATGTTPSWFEAAAQTQGVPGASPRRTTPKKSKAHRNYGGYAVFFGLTTGSFATWHEIAPLVLKVSCSLYQGYRTLELARAAYDYAHEHGWTRVLESPPIVSSQAPIRKLPSPTAGPNPLHAGIRCDGRWYVVFSGIHPAPIVLSASHSICHTLPSEPRAPSTVMSSTNSPGIVTQYQLLQRRKEVQREKTRIRMAQFRLRLKEMPSEEQEAFKARARDARARYRAIRYRHAFPETYADGALPYPTTPPQLSHVSCSMNSQGGMTAAPILKDC